VTAAGEPIRSVVKERDLPHPPEKVWRALTETALIEDWLMKSDFRAEEGHAFEFDAGWGKIACRVLTVAAPEVLSYSWDAAGLESVVTWTLEVTGAGTRLRMEQTGFRAGQGQAYGGARAGWERFLDRLETVLGDLDRQGERSLR
jgi:uncharacterized protein YndB with AHSA1/START domain